MWERDDAPPPLGSPYQMMLTSRYLQGSNDARRPDLMTEAVGQGVYFVDHEQPVGQIVDGLATDARRVLKGLTGR